MVIGVIIYDVYFPAVSRYYIWIIISEVVKVHDIKRNRTITIHYRINHTCSPEHLCLCACASCCNLVTVTVTHIDKEIILKSLRDADSYRSALSTAIPLICTCATYLYGNLTISVIIYDGTFTCIFKGDIFCSTIP